LWRDRLSPEGGSGATPLVRRTAGEGQRLPLAIMRPAMAAEPKQIVARLIEEVMNGGDLQAIDELCSPQMAGPAKEWIGPFREAFPDVEMEIVDLVGEGEKVAGRFRCSGTNLGEWRGQPPSGRRFEGIDEVYFFRVVDGRIAEAWGLEDTAGRLRQLGLGEDR
jgi:SnoaL-like polyketide cyclase